MQPHSFLFQGSKERLLRTVSREGGMLLENHKFKILWKCKRAKPLDKLPFHFLCSYENTGNGYRICYQIMPAITTVLRIVFSLLFAVYLAFLAWEQNSVKLIPLVFLFLVLPINWYISQKRACESEFRNVFGVVTSPRNGHDK